MGKQGNMEKDSFVAHASSILSLETWLEIDIQSNCVKKKAFPFSTLNTKVNISIRTLLSQKPSSY
jgi:hypothetical protein